MCETRKILIADKFIFTQGIYYTRQIAGRTSDYFALELLDYILPLSILYDEIILPDNSFDDLSEPFTKDLNECIGAKTMIRIESNGKTNNSKIVEKSVAYEIARLHSKILYELSGIFAAAHDDLIPAIDSISSLIDISNSLDIPISISNKYLSLYRDIARSDFPKTDSSASVSSLIFEMYNAPIVSLNTFRGSDGKIDLDLMFKTMKELRDNEYLNNFRSEIETMKENSEELVVNISKRVIHDFKELFEYCFNKAGGDVICLSQGVLSDFIGLFVPGTSTIKAGYDIWKKREAKRNFSWQFFIWDYDKKLKNL